MSSEHGLRNGLQEALSSAAMALTLVDILQNSSQGSIIVLSVDQKSLDSLIAHETGLEAGCPWPGLG